MSWLAISYGLAAFLSAYPVHGFFPANNLPLSRPMLSRSPFTVDHLPGCICVRVPSFVSVIVDVRSYNCECGLREHRFGTVLKRCWRSVCRFEELLSVSSEVSWHAFIWLGACLVQLIIFCVCTLRIKNAMCGILISIDESSDRCSALAEA